MTLAWRIAGLAGLVLALTGCGPRMEKVEVEIGYKGRARLNPFLAAWRLLESREWTVEERHGLTVLPTSGEVIVVSAESDQGGLAAQELAAWIEAGGHVVYLLAGAERFAPELDWEPKTDEETAKTGKGPVSRDENLKSPKPKEEMVEEEEAPSFPLLDEFELRVAPRGMLTRSCVIGKRTLSIEMPVGLGVKVPQARRQLPGVIRSAGRGPAGVASLPFGKGRLAVLGDARIWRNRHIGKADHATLFWEVMHLHGKATGAWFLSDTRISFFGLLWSNGWMPLTGLGIFIRILAVAEYSQVWSFAAGSGPRIAGLLWPLGSGGSLSLEPGGSGKFGDSHPAEHSSAVVPPSRGADGRAASVPPG